MTVHILSSLFQPIPAIDPIQAVDWLVREDALLRVL